MIAALLVGFIARLFGRLLPFVPALLFGKKEEIELPWHWKTVRAAG